MNTEELRDVMRSATTDLTPRPTLTGDVLYGGARRLRRRRITIAAVAVVAVAGASVVAVADWQSSSEPTQIATDPMMTEPTRGDLAKDTDFLAEAVRIWNRGHGPTVDKLVTKPHVYWAGNTPAGRAALVMQETDKGETIRGLVGVDVKSNNLALLIIDPPVIHRERDVGYRFGPGDRVVLAIEQDQPLVVSASVTYDDANKAGRTWERMTPADGVLLAQLPEDTGPLDAKVAIVNDGKQPTSDDVMDLVNADETAANTMKHREYGLGWGDNRGSIHMMWAGSTPPRHWNEQPWIVPRFQDGLAKSGLLDPASQPTNDPQRWYISVADGDGMIVIGEYTPVHSGPGRLYSVFLTADGKVTKVVPHGTASNGYPPVLVRLPGNRGVVVAGKDMTFSYRTAKGGTWSTPVREVLLMPDDTVEIKLSKPGQSDALIDHLPK